MTRRLAGYIEAGRALDSDEREIAALSLQQMNALRQAEADDAWRITIGGRVEGVLRGTVELVDADEHYAQLRTKLAVRAE